MQPATPDVEKTADDLGVCTATQLPNAGVTGGFKLASDEILSGTDRTRLLNRIVDHLKVVYLTHQGWTIKFEHNADDEVTWTLADTDQSEDFTVLSAELFASAAEFLKEHIKEFFPRAVNFKAVPLGSKLVVVSTSVAGRVLVCHLDHVAFTLDNAPEVHADLGQVEVLGKKVFTEVGVDLNSVRLAVLGRVVDDWLYTPDLMEKIEAIIGKYAHWTVPAGSPEFGPLMVVVIM